MSHLRSRQAPEDSFWFLLERLWVLLFMRPGRPLIKVQLRLIDRRWSTGEMSASGKKMPCRFLFQQGILL